MSDDTVRVRVAAGEFRYDREHYERGDELAVSVAALEKHPRSLNRLDEAAGESEDEPAADPDADDEAPDLAFDPDEIDPHPSDLTINELSERVEGVEDAGKLETIRYLEDESKDRTGAKDAIDDRLDELEA
jgi:hypothetical protein